MAEALKDLRDGDAGLREEGVVIAGYEEGDVQGYLLVYAEVVPVCRRAGTQRAQR
jgi:hypothetical protein